jgi:hypothetical protein
MPQILTAPEVVEQKLTGRRFFVELASHEVELDAWGIPVPVDFKTIDVVVTEPTREAISAQIVDYQWLKGYSIVDYWQPDSDYPF